VFTVPKRLRPLFPHDRRLLGMMSRVAYRTLRDFMRTTFKETDVAPGVVASIQSFGSLLNWHPHLHCLVTDGTFLPLGYHEIEVLAEAFRRGVLREFVRLDLHADDQAHSMLEWPHSGFHVDHSVRLETDDACGILQLARYAARAPIALDRLHYDARKEQVTLRSDKRDGPTAGTHVFPALEFLARLLAHVPDWPALQAMRQRWAVLLKRIFEVDPLRRLRCAGLMRILSLHSRPRRHHRHPPPPAEQGARPARALPGHAAASAGRAPP
jgi:hypothetical protein